MDAKESRRYTMSNPPIHRGDVERRPSLLGRLFRRSSSTDEQAIQNMKGSLGSMGSSFEEAATGERRTSITTTVKDQFVYTSRPIDSEFNIFT